MRGVFCIHPLGANRCDIVSAEIIQFGSDHDDFGLCPKCRRTDGYLNVGRVHFGICHRHRVKWKIGYNLFSGWRDESEATWQKNVYRLATYRLVQALHHRPGDNTPPPPAGA